MKLLVDDKRDMADGIIARDYDSGYLLLKTIEFDKLILDHDLGEGETGYDLVNKLIKEGTELPKIVYIISSNPVGAENIGRALRSVGYTNLGRKFERK